MTSSILLLDVSLVNSTIFALAANCPYVSINPFTDTISVDTFLTNNSTLLPTLNNIGCLNVFPSKSVLDYFEQQITLLYPTISHIDILDKNCTTLQYNNKNVNAKAIKNSALAGPDVAGPSVVSAGPSVVSAGPDSTSTSKIKFNNFNVGDKNNQTYFSTPLRILFNYVPLVFPTEKPNCTNIMLIDSTIPEAQVFYDAANTTTLPVIFNSDTLSGEIIQLLTLHTTINRLCVVATNENIYNNSKVFINNETYFTEADLSPNPSTYSNNVRFMIDLIQSYNIKTIDFLACESLTYTAWQNYYLILQGYGCTIGASTDETGNLAYGGNWIMESDNQNIQPVYFTNEIANYTTTLADTAVVNIVFGTYTPPGTNTLRREVSPYTLTNVTNARTYAIYNSTADQVTFKLANATAGLSYNVEINVVPTGYAGNGSNVTIDGSGVSIVPSTNLFNGGKSLVRVVDTLSKSLTNIIIQNINVNVTAYPTLTGTKRAWILRQGQSNQTGQTSINIINCSVYSNGSLTIGDSVNNCGGIVSGETGSYNKYTLTCTSCSVYSSGDLTINGGGIAVGGVYNDASLNFISCSVYSSTGNVTINSGGGMMGDLPFNINYLTFTSCSVYSSNGTLTINGTFTGGILTISSLELNSLIFTSCSVYSSGDLTIGGGGGGGGYNGGIVCSVGSNILTCTSCSVYSSNGNLTIGGGGGGSYNGGIVGSNNYIANSFNLSLCSVYSSNGNLTIGGGGGYNGGILGGKGAIASSLNLSLCSVYSGGYLTIGGGGFYSISNGGICSYGFSSSSFTCISCSVYSGGYLTIGGGGGYYNSSNGGIAGNIANGTFTSCSVHSGETITIGGNLSKSDAGIAGSNGGVSLIFISCSVYSSGNLTIEGGSGGYHGGIVGGGGMYSIINSLTCTSCSIYSGGILTINSGDGIGNNGGICGGGGGNYNDLTATFIWCSVSSGGDLTIGSGTNGGIAGGFNGNFISSIQFTSCSVSTNGILLIDGINSGGIAGGSITDNIVTTVNACTINSTTSVIVNDVTYDSSFLYISNSIPSPNTTPPTILDNGLICGYFGHVSLSYPSKSLLIVTNDVTSLFPPNTGPSLDTTFVGQNLSDMDLSGVNFSFYDLSGTILPSKDKCMPYGSSNYTGALITDSDAIATNIVIANNLTYSTTLTYSVANMNNGGMTALVNGLTIASYNLSAALSLFVSSLYTTALNKYNNVIDAIFVPVSTLPLVEPWINPIANSMVQLINATVYYNNASGLPKTNVDITSLYVDTACYFYFLVKNYPAHVTIYDISHNISFSANPPLIPSDTFNYSIDSGPVLTTTAGDTIILSN